MIKYLGYEIRRCTCEHTPMRWYISRMGGTDLYMDERYSVHSTSQKEMRRMIDIYTSYLVGVAAGAGRK